MRRIRTEILHYKKGQTHDKVYIVELFEAGESYYVYAKYGKRLQARLIQQLKEVADFEYTAIDTFERMVKKKIKEGYKLVGNGERIDIPGYSLVEADKAVKINKVPANNKNQKKEDDREHRRLIL